MTKLLTLLLLSPLAFADDHNEFTIGCTDNSNKKYQITLDMDAKKFSIEEKAMVISEGLIAHINTSNNEINFQLLEINTKDNKIIFTNKNILGQLVCEVQKA